MKNYLYIIVLISIFVYHFIKGIYLFNKGKYNSYVFKRGEFEEPFFISMTLSFAIIVCSISIKPEIIAKYILLIGAFSLGVCINVLNYLSYRKNKDKKITLHTIPFDIFLITMLMLIWRL